jgi:FkbM family methyltransferase
VEYGKDLILVFDHGLSDKPATVTFTYFPNTPALSTTFPEHWDENPKAFKLAVKGTMKNPPVGMRWMKCIPPIFSGLIAKQLLKGKRTVQCELKTLSHIIESHNISEINLLKIDCEGAEWFVLLGIKPEHWSLIKQLVIEVHDVDGRLAKTIELLKEKGFDKLITEREKGLEHTQMYNVFAMKS